MYHTDYSDPAGARASIVAQEAVYCDVPLSFTPHPLTEQIIPVKDLESVRQSVYNLVMTNHYERPFKPELGGNIQRRLFDNATYETASRIQRDITRCIQRFEPRVADPKVTVTDDSENNRFNVSVSFRLLPVNLSGEFGFFLNRLR